MKHNISITVDQKLFREIENVRGREKRSTFIEYLLISGLKNYKNEVPSAMSHQAPFRVMPSASVRFASVDAARIA